MWSTSQSSCNSFPHMAHLNCWLEATFLEMKGVTLLRFCRPSLDAVGAPVARPSLGAVGAPVARTFLRAVDAGRCSSSSSGLQSSEALNSSTLESNAS